MPGGTSPRFALPVVLTASNNTINITTGATTEDVTIAAGTYFWRGDGTAADLKTALFAALNTNTGGGVYAGSLGIDLGIVVSCTVAFSLNWAAGTTTADSTIFGFLAANKGDALVPYVVLSDHLVLYAWTPYPLISLDGTNATPKYRAAVATAMSDRERTARWGPKRQRKEITVDLLPPSRVFLDRETLVGEAFERFWVLAGDGTRFEFAPNIAVPGTYATVQIAEQEWKESMDSPACVQIIPVTLERYTARIPMKSYVG